MNQHKDLPSGSQSWAKDVDDLMEENKHLKEVVRRLCENAGLDYSNPKRGRNTGGAPSTNNPVGQKLSSLADTDTYNVADGQYLSWNQKGQKWLPVTLPEATSGEAIDIPMSYSSSVTGYGQIESPFGFFAYTGTNPGGDAELWGSNGTYIGSGDYVTGTTQWTLIELSRDGFSRPFIQLNAYDDADTSWAYAILSSYKFRLQDCVFVAHRCTTANRPTWLGNVEGEVGAMVYDSTLNIPIWWNGTAWTNALGTAV